MKKITFEDITLKNKNGICYNTYKNHLYIIAIDKTQFKIHTLKRNLKKQHKYIMFEDIPNEFIQYDLLNPNHIDVLYISWFDTDIDKNNEDMINEIKKYQYKKSK